jgi:hypothetical protein
MDTYGNEEREVEELNQWAQSHETSYDVAEAIYYVALGTGGDVDIAMEGIWDEPSESEAIAVWEFATENGLKDDKYLFWGIQTLHEVMKDFE